MAEFGATDDLVMTTDEANQLVEIMSDIKSGYYPAVALELLRRLKVETKAKANMQPALVVFGRFLVGNRIANFPDDVIAWRTERDYLSLVVDELNDVIARKNGKLADFRMRHSLDDENTRAELKRLTEVIKGLEGKLRVLSTVREVRNALSDEVIGLKREATDSRAENLTLREEVEALQSKLDFAQACALSYETQLSEANRYLESLRLDNSRMVEERNNWRRAKQESDDTIKQICALIPRNENEDVYQAIERLISERQRIGTNLIDIRQSVESFLQQFGSWVEPNGTRHCNGLHVGHSLCEALA